MGLALVVHGGAGDIAAESVEAHRRGTELAARAGWRVLQQGGSALEAVEASIIVMEDDPAFDAGTGSVLNRDGEVEMDAGLMDGRTLNTGAVAGVMRVKNPIRLARRVMESEVTFLIARGADRFAEQVGIPLIENAQLRTPEQVEKWMKYLANPPAPEQARYLEPKGTVGCVALDRTGNIAAGTSTGGMKFKRVGRVGDSPLIGCGFYADSQLGGASTTGWGESIMRVVLSKYAVDALGKMAHPREAARAAIEHLARRVGGTGGIILCNMKGEVGFSYNTPRMARAYVTAEHEEIIAEC